ncbi:hypothetical protein BH11PSE11_BH11PSE11_21180 [soil metagenome]
METTKRKMSSHDVRFIRRVKLLQKLIGGFGTSQMTVKEVATYLKLPRTNAYRFVRTLCEKQIIEAENERPFGTGGGEKVIYRLSPDAANADAFEVSAMLTGLSVPARAQGLAHHAQLMHSQEQGSQFMVTEFEGGSRMHYLADDSIDFVRPHHTPPRRDPMVAAFFGVPKDRQNSHAGPKAGRPA